jgi:hypothetical protein
MPLQRTETYTTTGTKGSWNTDYSIAPFQASINVTLTAGTTSYKLQYSLDPLDSPTAVDSDANWIDSADIAAGTTGSATATFTAPIARVRLVITTLSGGNLVMTMIQGMSIN